MTAMNGSGEEWLGRIGAALAAPGDRPERARRFAEAVRKLADFRWAGIYDVGDAWVSIIAWSGPGEPAYPRFSVSQGLTGAAIRARKTVVAGDVRNDPRYLTAFGSTRSEIIIPVLDEVESAVVGTIDVESEKVNAFSRREQELLEACAQLARPLWQS
jgi:putative methionine-R-sulfoxide reductase with GAF domain